MSFKVNDSRITLSPFQCDSSWAHSQRVIKRPVISKPLKRKGLSGSWNHTNAFNSTLQTFKCECPLFDFSKKKINTK